MEEKYYHKKIRKGGKLRRVEGRRKTWIGEEGGGK